MTPQELASIEEIVNRLVDKRVNDRLKEVFSQLADNTSNPNRREDWVDANKAWIPLGYPSYNALYNAIQCGLFREGTELRDRRNPGAKIARWQVNLSAVNKRLSQEHSKRRVV